jgi:hypothetical protein
MGGFRTLTAEETGSPPRCERCHATGCSWDRIGGRAICPDCQELLILGEGEPLRLSPEQHLCAACAAPGTVSFITVPLQSKALAIDLCPLHLRGLLRRGLEREAFLALRRQLSSIGLTPDRIFLLHEAFYDETGRALRPVSDPA